MGECLTFVYHKNLHKNDNCSHATTLQAKILTRNIVFKEEITIHEHFHILTKCFVVNSVANGEIAQDEQLLLLSQCFQKSATEASEKFYMRVRSNFP